VDPKDQTNAPAPTPSAEQLSQREAELKARLDAMEQQQKQWTAREAEYVGVINRFAEQLPQNDRQQEPNDEPDPMLVRTAEKLTAPLRQQLMQQADQLDSMQFMNAAAMMGLPNLSARNTSKGVVRRKYYRQTGEEGQIVIHGARTSTLAVALGRPVPAPADTSTDTHPSLPPPSPAAPHAPDSAAPAASPPPRLPPAQKTRA